MPTPNEWFARKLSGRLWKLRGPRRVVEEWKKSTGRGHYAKVALAAYPADAFSFESSNAWPETQDQSHYEPYVLDGILDELMQGPGEPVLGLRLVLEQAVVHGGESNGYSFYQAARLATQKILSSGEGHRDNCYLVDG